jgi:N-acyl-D-aspartate/D-glutamate deacylase
MTATLLRGGTVFDGSRSPGVIADVRLQDGVVTDIARALGPRPGEEVVDAAGCWVTPGFLDIHTHYDAEVELAPGLTESLRHGVTTVLLGSCGLSLAVGTPVDLADMFCRVEGIPRSTVLPLLERIKDWEDPAGYLDHLDRLPLGPNVACLLGHSTIRAAAMGMDRSLDASVRPTEAEIGSMEALLGGALDAGYLGLSINTLKWDKMDGERHRSAPLPSTFATWGEYRRLMRPLRARGRVLQGVPNLATKLNVLLFALASAGIGRRALKTTIIALMDPKVDRFAVKAAGLVARLTNALLGGDLRFQALPCPFDVWTDGLDNPVIEEFGAGTAALHEADPQKRAALLRHPAFRARFAKDWRGGLVGQAYHRDLDEPRILACPDGSVVGRSFTDVARERGVAPIDAFLDLQAAHGDALRWYSVVANDRPDVLAWVLTRPDILMGFSDAGAHLRNMAYYNFPLRLLKRVRDGAVPGMDVAWAVHRLSGEIADWMGVDAGHLAPGRRADVVLVDPAGLDDSVEEAAEAPMPGFPALQRVVRRNDRAVRGVWVAGRRAWTGQGAGPGLGEARGFGRVLRASA